ncbi:MAG: lipoate--protein ligase family protein [bacterium]|nr:lipoate--protein ligase family protein [bacterium]
MARDEYLFNLCHSKKIGFLRLYAWDRPSFSFGVSQKTARAVDTQFVNNNNYAYVRRITGGKTVLHNHEITYAVVSSEDVFYKENDLYKSYMLIAGVLVDAFRSIGVQASLSQGSARALSKTNNPCFSFPTPNEIEINGKKIIGSAQKRDNTALLQHGSIPISMDYELYAEGANSRAHFIREHMTTLSDVTTCTPEDFRLALVESFGQFIGAPLKEFEFDKKDLEAIALLEEKYGSDNWNFRS